MAAGSTMPQRWQRVLGARWLFAAVVLVVGLGTLASSGGAVGGAVWVGLVIAGYNSVLAMILARRTVASSGLTVAQLALDSLATVAAIHYGMVLTPAVEFLFLFPLFSATLLHPREGLFLTAAFCGTVYAVAEMLTYVGLWPPQAEMAPGDRILGSLAAVGVVIGALLSAASILNYLVRTLAGVEEELRQSEADYRRLAASLEDEVRQRTADLRRANEELSARNRELLRLQEIDAAIHASDDVGTVLQRVVDGVAEIVPDSQAAILLKEPNAEQLRLAAVSTSAERRAAAIESLLGTGVRELRLPLAAGTLVEYAVRTREMIITSDFGRLVGAHVRSPERQALVPDIVRILAFKTFVALPLVVGEDLIGLLALGSRRDLVTPDLERVRAFATQAAIAMARVRQERDLLEQSAALEQAYLELQLSQDQVVHLEKMRAIGEMTSGVAHNFNNHLTTVLGTAQLMLMGELPQEMVHRLRLIERTAQDAALLVQRIRAFTKDEPPQTHAADVNELVADAIAMTEPRWRHHADRIESPINVTHQLEARRMVEVDAAAIREVLVNLILNAVNALPEGGSITCRTWEDGELVKVAVRDTGVGMTEETRQRCFEPFYTTGGEKGTGLGLSVAYGIIQRHNGDIQVSSQRGVGTEFVLALPVAEAEVAARPEPAEVPAPSQVPPLHALVVDDQVTVRETLGSMLEALGHSASMAANGAEAVSTFNPGLHRIVITDWGMPGMSGLAVARAIKGRSPGTPVVLVTGFDANLPPEVAEAEEIDGRLQKPVGLQDLARALERLARF